MSKYVLIQGIVIAIQMVIAAALVSIAITLAKKKEK